MGDLSNKHLLTPEDLFRLCVQLKSQKKDLAPEYTADLWYVKDGRLELRRQHYYLPMLKTLPSNKKVRILDCGCGSGGFIQTANRAGYYNCTGVDVSKVGIARAIMRCPKAKFFVGDLRYAHELSGNFDVIVLSEVLEHFLDDVEILESTVKKLTKQGYFACSVPYNQRQESLGRGHVRSYTEKILHERYGHIGRVKVLEITKSGYQHLIFTIKETG